MGGRGKYHGHKDTAKASSKTKRHERVQCMTRSMGGTP